MTNLDHQPALNWLLYDAMMAADDIFQALLEQEYGSAAGDKRYAYHHDREDINVAARQATALAQGWFRYYQGRRDSWGL